MWPTVANLGQPINLVFDQVWRGLFSSSRSPSPPPTLSFSFFFLIFLCPRVYIQLLYVRQSLIRFFVTILLQPSVTSMSLSTTTSLLSLFYSLPLLVPYFLQFVPPPLPSLTSTTSHDFHVSPSTFSPIIISPSPNYSPSLFLVPVPTQPPTSSTATSGKNKTPKRIQ